MNFLFNLSNHTEGGQRTLHDPAMVMIHQLRALGHKAHWNNAELLIGPGSINVLFECFATESSIESVAEGHRRGARFAIVATEEPTEKGFNHGILDEMVERQRMFPKVARYADAIFCLVPGSEGWYGQFAPAVRLELGWAPTLEQPAVPPGDVDFAFFGSFTKRREKVLTTLARRARAKVLPIYGFPPQRERTIAAARAKVIVQVRGFEAMGLVSSSRCNTALHLGRPVIAEPHELSHPWEEVIKFSASLDAFYQDCRAAAPLWRVIHGEQMRRFRDLFSPARTIGKALAALDLVERAAVFGWSAPMAEAAAA